MWKHIQDGLDAIRRWLRWGARAQLKWDEAECEAFNNSQCCSRGEVPSHAKQPCKVVDLWDLSHRDPGGSSVLSVCK